MIKYLLLTLGITCFSLNAQAELADKDKPLQLEANQGSYDDINQVYKLNGRVVLTKGSMIIKTETAFIKNTPSGYQHATATNGPNGLAYVRQKREGIDEFFEGYGDKIEYNSQTNVITLIGRAKILRLDKQNKVIDEIQAPKMIYNGNNETYNAIGSDSSSSRVRAVISPKNNNSNNNGRVNTILPPPTK